MEGFSVDFKERDFLYLDLGKAVSLIENALSEDRAFNDITSLITIPSDQVGKGIFKFKSSGILCGIEIAKLTFKRCSNEIEFTALCFDGDAIDDGEVVAEIQGPLRSMLSAERVALNFMQRLSGIASLTHQYVKEAALGGNSQIVDTRKTTPGLREFERYAVRCGGAKNHRDTLSDGILIKDNHIASAAARGISITDLISVVQKKRPHTLKIEIEVDTPEQAIEAVSAGADIILLDNMSAQMVTDIITNSPQNIIFEASGGVNLSTVKSIAGTGAHLISVGALTHSAPALDISLDITPT
tara:strand:- start:3743 stop:4639 length:897 start_codon:yes stop_codon:yes gene_type:complete